jgi:hypothetical protein
MSAIPAYRRDNSAQPKARKCRKTPDFRSSGLHAFVPHTWTKDGQPWTRFGFVRGQNGDSRHYFGALESSYHTSVHTVPDRKGANRLCFRPISECTGSQQEGAWVRSPQPLPNSECSDGFPPSEFPMVPIATSWAEKYKFKSLLHEQL